ncbi:Flp pilus assembly protein CpaB [Arthrobacter echini]|uniref:Flp pilus assembly protein CpaB n=1 Tax=Arthrobacter echini TaxID=1529066 RepID=A0A4S5E296_9MICC|nr:Flp pilus assembly protein CpaB [Arthrobacter echini]THJ65504.1 Flp pilus assembly protein CpaB [Arthrobacter echini]
MDHTRHQGATLRYRLRRALHRHRRLLACLLFCAAAGVAVEAVVGDEPASTPVVGAVRDLASGTVLSEADLAILDFPEGTLVEGMFDDAGQVVGQQLATPLGRGSPVYETALVGEGLLTGTPPGTVAVPLRPADPATVQLLTPGQLVDVVLSTGDSYDATAESAVLARAVAVLWTDTGASGGTWPGADPDGGLVVVAAGAADAAALAGSSSSGEVHLVLTSGP